MFKLATPPFQRFKSLGMAKTKGLPIVDFNGLTIAICQYSLTSSSSQTNPLINFRVNRIPPTNHTKLQMKKLSSTDRFRFLTEKTIKQEKIELTRFQSAQLRSKLPPGIYYLQITKAGLVQWNWTLLQDYLVNGDRPEHQKLVEEYLSTLPTAA